MFSWHLPGQLGAGYPHSNHTQDLPWHCIPVHSTARALLLLPVLIASHGARTLADPAPAPTTYLPPGTGQPLSDPFRAAVRLVLPLAQLPAHVVCHEHQLETHGHGA